MPVNRIKNTIDLLHVGSNGSTNVRTDGWANAFSRQGIEGKDRYVDDTFIADRTFTETTLDSIYRSAGFGKRIIDLPNEAMVRDWFRVTSDTDEDVNAYLMGINAKPSILTGLKWADIFGGSVVLVGADDGAQFLEEPLNEGNIRSIEFLRPYDRFQVTWNTVDLFTDPKDPRFGTPEFFKITPSRMTEFRVHVSRLLFFEGEAVSDRRREINNGWGDSKYQSTFRQLSDLGGVHHATRQIVEDFVQTIIQIDNLQDLLLNGQEQLIKDRINLMDLSRHVLNAVVLDTKEQYSKQASSIAGVSDVIKDFGMALAAVTSIPFSLLMGRTPTGLNSAGEGEEDQWFNHVSDLQESKLLTPMTRLVELVELTQDAEVQLEEGWKIEFNALTTPDPKTVAETRKIIADTDDIYIMNGTILSDEVRESRFGGTDFSPETAIEAANTARLLEGETEEDPENQNEDAFVFLQTSIKNRHTHIIFEIDEDGNGVTDVGGEDNHTHKVTGGIIGVGGTDSPHIHILLGFKKQFFENDSSHPVRRKKKKKTRKRKRVLPRLR